MRIYALAKKLEKSNKELLDACKELGINGKSNLASLSDEEAKRVTAYFRELEEAKKAGDDSKFEMVRPAPSQHIPSGSGRTGKPVVLQPNPNRVLFFGNKKEQRPAVEPAKASNEEAPKVETPAVEQAVEKKPEEKEEAEAKKVESSDAVPEKVVEVSEPEKPVKTDEPKVEEKPVEKADVEKEEPKSDVEGVKTADDGSKTPETEPSTEAKQESADPSKTRTAGRGTSSTLGKKPAPLGTLMSRRERGGDHAKGERKERGDRRPNANRAPEQRPARPVMPSYLTVDPQALQEMKAPPMITTLPSDNGRVRVLGGGPKKSGSSSGSSGTASGGTSGNRSGGKTNLNLHLAPIPASPQKSIPKKTSEEPAQKPIRVLTPEAFRNIRSGGIGAGPLANHLLDKSSRKQTKDGDAHGGTDRRADRDAKRGDAQRGAKRDELGGSSRDRMSRMNGFLDPSTIDSGKGGRGDRKRKGERDTEGDVSRNRFGARGEQPRRRNAGIFGANEDDEPASRVVRRRGGAKRTSAPVTMPRVSDIVIEVPCTVKQFSEATGVSVATVIKELMKLGAMKTMNQTIDNEMVGLLIISLDLKATIKEEATLEEQYVDSVYEEVDPPESLVPRSPVVTFLGHVDHGKTSLLDRILHLHVVSGEKGGITQHIRAYRVETPRGAVTFVDTPGHEAFTEMRARGANCTDVAVLVVAADDGVMPQTEEAISHAKAAGVPIVVALNKMDLPGVNRDRVIQELANNDLMPSEWGGDVEVVNTSAITGMGVDELLDTLLMVAELHELKANPNRRASGVVLEASLQAGEGVVCKALVQNGTLHNGDVVLCGGSYGRVRSMSDTLDEHKRLKEAGPSVPVSLVGLDVAPEAGSKFVVLEDISIARQIAEERQKRAREIELAGSPGHVTLENLFERMGSAKQQTLHVIIRADVRGSIEAIRKELGKLEHPEVKVKILQASVGGITEADVHLADASDAIIVGFNVVPDEGARALAEKKKVQIRRYDVIYKLTEDIRAALEGMLKPIEQVKELGRALVQRTFNISRVGVIAGCRVLYGTIERDCQIRVVRDSRIIGEYALDTLRREKDDVKEVRDGYECGIKLKNYNDVKEGDILEAYKIEEVARTF